MLYLQMIFTMKFKDPKKPKNVCIANNSEVF